MAKASKSAGNKSAKTNDNENKKANGKATGKLKVESEGQAWERGESIKRAKYSGE